MEIVSHAHTRGRKASYVWEFFGHPKVDGAVDKNITVCRLCKEKMPYTGGTSTMGCHMQRHHPVEVSKAQGMVE